MAFEDFVTPENIHFNGTLTDAVVISDVDGVKTLINATLLTAQDKIELGAFLDANGTEAFMTWNEQTNYTLTKVGERPSSPGGIPRNKLPLDVWAMYWGGTPPLWRFIANDEPINDGGGGAGLDVTVLVAALDSPGLPDDCAGAISAGNPFGFAPGGVADSPLLLTAFTGISDTGEGDVNMITVILAPPDGDDGTQLSSFTYTVNGGAPSSVYNLVYMEVISAYTLAAGEGEVLHDGDAMFEAGDELVFAFV